MKLAPVLSLILPVPYRENIHVELEIYWKNLEGITKPMIYMKHAIGRERKHLEKTTLIPRASCPIFPNR